MSKNSPKKRLSTFRNWLTTVKPAKLDRNKKKKSTRKPSFKSDR